MATATNPDFSALLSRQSAAVERPKQLPIGNYIWSIKGLPRFDKSVKKGTPFVEFTCMPLEAQDDVDQDDLEAALTRKDGTKKLLGDMTQRLTFYLTEDALWRLKQFLVRDCQIEEGEKTLEQLINDSPGSQFMGTISHTPTDDGEGVYANIKSTAVVA